MGSRRALLLMACAGMLVPANVRAGKGTIRDGLLNLTVLFTYEESDRDTWKKLFRAADVILYRATDGHLQFGQIVFTESSSARTRADCVIDQGSGNAHIEGEKVMGDPSTRIQLYRQDDSTAALTLIHELGHYAFGLWDEYKG